MSEATSLNSILEEQNRLLNLIDEKTTIWDNKIDSNNAEITGKLTISDFFIVDPINNRVGIGLTEFFSDQYNPLPQVEIKNNNDATCIVKIGTSSESSTWSSSAWIGSSVGRLKIGVGANTNTGVIEYVPNDSSSPLVLKLTTLTINQDGDITNSVTTDKIKIYSDNIQLLGEVRFPGSSTNFISTAGSLNFDSNNTESSAKQISWDGSIGGEFGIQTNLNGSTPRSALHGSTRIQLSSDTEDGKLLFYAMTKNANPSTPINSYEWARFELISNDGSGEQLFKVVTHNTNIYSSTITLSPRASTTDGTTISGLQVNFDKKWDSSTELSFRSKPTGSSSLPAIRWKLTCTADTSSSDAGVSGGGGGDLKFERYMGTNPGTIIDAPTVPPVLKLSRDTGIVSINKLSVLSSIDLGSSPTPIASSTNLWALSFGSTDFKLSNKSSPTPIPYLTITRNSSTFVLDTVTFGNNSIKFDTTSTINNKGIHIEGSRVLTSRQNGWTGTLDTVMSRDLDTLDSPDIDKVAKVLKALIKDLTTHGLIGA